MAGLFLLLLAFVLLFIIVVPSFFAWLYWVTPASDLERIKGDQDGTGARVLKIERTGVEYTETERIWRAGHTIDSTGAHWYRIYEVTIEREDRAIEQYTIAVEARPFGVSSLKRYGPNW